MSKCTDMSKRDQAVLKFVRTWNTRRKPRPSMLVPTTVTTISAHIRHTNPSGKDWTGPVTGGHLYDNGIILSENQVRASLKRLEACGKVRRGSYVPGYGWEYE
jgi:hypothetical protein